MALIATIAEFAETDAIIEELNQAGLELWLATSRSADDFVTTISLLCLVDKSDINSEQS